MFRSTQLLFRSRVTAFNILQGLRHDGSLKTLEIADRNAIGEEFVDLFQRSSFSLWDAEVEKHQAAEI